MVLPPIVLGRYRRVKRLGRESVPDQNAGKLFPGGAGKNSLKIPETVHRPAVGPGQLSDKLVLARGGRHDDFKREDRASQGRHLAGLRLLGQRPAVARQPQRDRPLPLRVETCS